MKLDKALAPFIIRGATNSKITYIGGQIADSNIFINLVSSLFIWKNVTIINPHDFSISGYDYSIIWDEILFDS